MWFLMLCPLCFGAMLVSSVVKSGGEVRRPQAVALSRGEVRALHGVESVDGVPHARLQGADLGGGHEAVAEAGEGGVAVDVVEDGVVPCGEERGERRGEETPGDELWQN